MELKESLAGLMQERQSCLDSIKDLESSICAKQRQISVKEHSHEAQLKQLQSEKFVEFQQQILAPYNLAIQKQEDRKLRLAAAKNEKLNEIAQVDYHKKYTNLQNIEETDAIYQDILERTSNFYGAEFTSVVFSMIPSQVTTSKDLENLLVQLKKCPSILNHSFDVNSLITSLLGKKALNKEGDHAVVFYAIAALLLVAGLFWIYPIILLLLAGSLMYCIYKSHVFVKCAFILKNYKDNVDRVEGLIEQYTAEAIDRDKRAVEDSYTVKLAELNDIIQKIQAESDFMLEIKAKDFIFNPDELNHEFNTVMETLKKQITELKCDLATAEKKRDELSAQIGEVQEQLRLALENLAGEFTPQEPLEQNVLPEEYLFDVVGDKPITFKLPRKSALFFYSSDEVAMNFQQLLFIQTIRRTSPSLVTFHVHDTEYMCKNFILYEGDKSTPNVDWIKLSISEKDVTDSINQCNVDFITLRKTIRMYSDLFEYNDAMIEMENPPEPFNFIFSFKPSSSVLSSTNFKQLVKNGHTCGYFTYIFIPLKDLEEGNDAQNLSSLADDVSSIYKLTDDSLNVMSKAYCKNLLSSD